jgi:hypothetical protein
LDAAPADSKPSVWWNLKYKNRWLSDGSVVSGNPIFTNILWNEIGRGADLELLDNWLKNNSKTIDALTAATFATQPPSYFDFFPVETFDLEAARRGESVFNSHCERCHGTYEKNWSKSDSSSFSSRALLETFRVNYHFNTPVLDVGTDSSRREGMNGVANQLNRLRISKANNIKVEVTQGYVPPPLVGIWARWPYFHNNSAPSLCAVLSPNSERPKSYFAGEAQNKSTDFDNECVGYPIGEQTPKAWKRDGSRFFDSTRKGLSNRGHDEGIFLKDGQDLLSKNDKMDLISFLKTL